MDGGRAGGRAGIGPRAARDFGRSSWDRHVAAIAQFGNHQGKM